MVSGRCRPCGRSQVVQPSARSQTDRMRLTLAFAVLLQAPLMAGNGPIPADWPSGAEGDVLESVVWYRLGNNISGITLQDGRLVRKATGEPADIVVCLELERTSDAAPEPAPGAFLARFAEVPEIALGSECTADLAGDYETASCAFQVGCSLLSDHPGNG
jgi:hypothetical protein